MSERLSLPQRHILLNQFRILSYLASDKQYEEEIKALEKGYEQELSDLVRGVISRIEGDFENIGGTADTPGMILPKRAATTEEWLGKYRDTADPGNFDDGEVNRSSD